MKLNISLNQALLAIVSGYMVITGGTIPTAMLAMSLVAFEVISTLKFIKQKEIEMEAINKAILDSKNELLNLIEKQKIGLDSKIGTLDSRIATFTAFRK